MYILMNVFSLNWKRTHVYLYIIFKIVCNMLCYLKKNVFYNTTYRNNSIMKGNTIVIIIRNLQHIYYPIGI